MDKQYVILEVAGRFTWFANATSTEPPEQYTDIWEARQAAHSFRQARPASRFLVIDISPDVENEGAL